MNLMTCLLLSALFIFSEDLLFSPRNLIAQENLPQLVKDINLNQESESGPVLMEAIGDTLYFAIDDGVHGDELWRSDGTVEGTQLVKDILPGAEGSQIRQWIDLDGLLIFGASDQVFDWEASLFGNVEPWVSDGTPEGTIKLVDINPTASSNPNMLAKLGTDVYFSAQQEEGAERSLWKTDGTAAGTMAVEAPAGTEFYRFEALTSTTAAFFTSDEQEVNLWLFDSATDSSTLIKSFGPTYVEPNEVIDGTYYFQLKGDDGTALWQTDGTVDGTLLIKNFDQEPYNDINGIAKVGEFIYLSLQVLDGNAIRQLWKSDGTTAGTIKITEVCHFGLSSFQNRVIFIGSPNSNCLDSWIDYELWTSDGTAEGTTLLKAIHPDPTITGMYYAGFYEHNGVLYFYGDNEVNGTELWSTDGTELGTAMVADINLGNASSVNMYGLSGYSLDLARAGSKVFFVANDGMHGYELWSMNATTTVTPFIASNFVYLPVVNQ